MQNTRLLFLLLPVYLATACTRREDDTELIKKLLVKESATWRNGDGKAHADCWVITPESRILVSLPDGRHFDVPPANMIDEHIKAAGGHAENSNYRIKISGDLAVVQHDEVSTDTAGQKSYSHETRILLRTAKGWKLNGQSLHIYKPAGN